MKKKEETQNENPNRFEKFRDPAVQEKYEATGDDVTIRFGHYHGKLSKISEAVAQKLIKVNDPNIKERAAT